MDYLTLVELNERIVGFNEREDREWQRFAWLGAAIVSSLTGKRIKPSSLLPGVFPEFIPYTKEEKQRELDEIKKEVGLLN